MALKVGCCGFPVARKVYYQHFRCVEVQQTFYHPPEERTLRRWREEAPGDFEFTVKAWQLITHEPRSPTYRRLRLKLPEGELGGCGGFKPTDRVLWAWEVTKASALALGARIVIFQTPPSFRPCEEALANLRSFFSSIDRGGLLLGWEPRGWPSNLVRELCRELDLFHVVDPFKDEATWGPLRYWRLHGRDGYRYRYSDEELRDLVARVERGMDHYVMFNNTEMFEDAKRFLELLGRDA